MPTLRRELRTKIIDVLEGYGIFLDTTPPIADVLADAVLGVAGISSAQASRRFGVAPVGKNSQEMAVKRLALGERIEAQLQIIPDHSKANWKRVLNRIVEAEEDGETLEQYVKWFKAGNEYNRPKRFQIVKNPNLIIGTWKEAMMFGDAEVTRNEDGSINV